MHFARASTERGRILFSLWRSCAKMLESFNERNSPMMRITKVDQSRKCRSCSSDIFSFCSFLLLGWNRGAKIFVGYIFIDHFRMVIYVLMINETLKSDQIISGLSKASKFLRTYFQHILHWKLCCNTIFYKWRLYWPRLKSKLRYKSILEPELVNFESNVQPCNKY